MVLDMKLFLRFGNYIVLCLIILLAIISFYKSGYFDNYTETQVIKSEIDYDGDGIDDYTDILEGAKELIGLKPKYKSKYYDGGYPTDNYMVCTDILWYALKNAGYDFKEMIDNDIEEHQELYDDVGDPNIDFRRVRNIKVYLDNHAEVLSNESDFNPGDIVIYKDHLAIVSDKVNKDKENYIIHIHPFYNYEDNGLFRNEIVGHYRWNLKEIEND